MSLKFYVILFFFIFIYSVLPGQNKAVSPAFDHVYWNKEADKRKLNPADRAEFLTSHQRVFIEEQRKISFSPLETVTNNSKYGQGTVNAGPCTNIDFESGNLTGWTRTSGFHPLYNVTGCCPNTGGQQTIMTGTGLDPFGLFPVVFPGGNFSLRLGNSGVNGQADRLSQTFFVTSANANFTYRYAVVLQDPGHTVAQQPAFVIEMVDSLGNQIPCTTYSVAAGNNIPGFFPSPTNTSVVYKPWTNVAMDLTPVIGQNVTIRFTSYDCSLGGHFGYAYVDGLCTNFATSTADTTCLGTAFNMCGPVGFATYNWNGPGVVNNPNRCINASAAGVYTCQTILVPGCPGPTFTHTLTTLPKPVLSYTTTGPSACSTQYTFAGTASITAGSSIVSYLWTFGDNTTSNQLNATHNYPGPGTYNVKLKATSNRGCADSVMQTITIYPFPVLAFSPPSNCINTVVQFTNSSTIAAGSIVSYTWNLGNGAVSNLINPQNTYTTNGTYTITLNATSNQGCTVGLTQTLGIFPPPVISFSANPLCDINGTSFSPSTSTAIASGSLVSFAWNFGDGGTSNVSNPVHVYAAPGTFTVTFTATSNHACIQTVTNSFIISPSPTVAFSTTSVNNCATNYTFTNTSSGTTALSYSWSFGGGNSSTLASTSYTFPGAGNYTVKLVGTNNFGCSDTAVQNITIYAFPSVSLGIPASCENAVFSGSAMPLSGTVSSFQWDFGDPGSGANNTSTLQNPTHNYTVMGNYTVSLLVTSNMGCIASYSTSTVVYPNPVAAFTFSTNNACTLPYAFINNSAVSPNVGNSIANYYWQLGSPTNTSTVAAPNFTFAGPGTYSVSLIAITNHNCSDTASVTIQVHPFPLINFSLSPTCLNIPATFTSSSSISTIPDPLASISSYTWNYGDNTFTNSINAPPHTYPTDGNYTVSMSATSNQGCVSTVTNQLVIHPVPVISFTTNGNMCFGFVTSFTTTNNIASPASLSSYAWNFGDGGTATIANPTHSYITNGSYPVNYSVTSNNGCVTSLTNTVTIHPLPVISATGNNACLNTQTQFNTTANIVSGSINSYSWNFGDGNTSLIPNPAYTYTAFSNNGPYIATVTAVSNEGCLKTATVPIVIHPLPNISYTPPGACENAVVQFSNTSGIALGSITSYTWNFANGATSNLMNPVSTYTLYGPYVVTLTATSNQGCIDTAATTFTVYPLPQAIFSPINNNCLNNAVTFTPNALIATGVIATYTLNFGDGISTSSVLGVPVTAVHNYSVYNSYTVSLVMLSDKNCTNTAVTTITIYPKPIPSFYASKFCDKDITTFINTSTIPSPTVYSITDHYWEFDGINVSAAHSPSFTFSGPGTYTVKLTETSKPEPGLDCIASTQSVIVINPLPAVSFTNNNVCHGNPVTFLNTTTTSGTNNVIAWAWDHENDGLANSLFVGPVNFVYPSVGSYTAVLTATNNFNCVNSHSTVVEIYANPTPSFVVTNVCQGDSTSFVNLSNGAINYNWNFGNGNQSAQQHPKFLYGTAGNYTAQLTAISDKGCSKKATSSFSVHHLPVMVISANEACFGKNTTFANTSYVPVGTVSKLVWDYENNGYDDSSTTSLVTPIIYSAPGNHFFKLTGVTNFGCRSTTTLSVKVRDNPIADFSFNGKVCSGDKMIFNDVSTPVDGSITARSWDFNADNITDASTSQSSYTFVNSGPNNIRLEVTSQYGCTGMIIKPLYVNGKAKALYTADKTSGCPPVCVNFENNSTIPSGTFTTQWNFGDGSPKVTGSTVSHCYNSGNHELILTLISDSGCVTTLRHLDAITVFDNPVAGFNVNPEDVNEEEPIIDVVSTATDNDFIKYYINDGSTYNKINFTHTFKNLENKSKPMIVQIVKNKYGCADTLYKILEVRPAFTIYFPNVFTPNADEINDSFTAKGVGIVKFEMQIFDRWGEQVFSTRDITNAWDGRSKGSDEPKQDVYTWKAQVIDVFNKSHEFIGHVSIIR